MKNIIILITFIYTILGQITYSQNANEIIMPFTSIGRMQEQLDSIYENSSSSFLENKHIKFTEGVKDTLNKYFANSNRLSNDNTAEFMRRGDLLYRYYINFSSVYYRIDSVTSYTIKNNDTIPIEVSVPQPFIKVSASAYDKINTVTNQNNTGFQFNILDGEEINLNYYNDNKFCLPNSPKQSYLKALSMQFSDEYPGCLYNTELFLREPLDSNKKGEFLELYLKFLPVIKESDQTVCPEENYDNKFPYRVVNEVKSIRLYNNVHKSR